MWGVRGLVLALKKLVVFFVAWTLQVVSRFGCMVDVFVGDWGYSGD